MSRYYGMEVSIAGHSPHRTKAIKTAAGAAWPFENWSEGDAGLVAYAEDRLCGGETEEAFAVRLAESIWRANGAFCEVQVRATYLEDLPSELYCPDDEDYQRFAKRRRKRGRQLKEQR